MKRLITLPSLLFVFAAACGDDNTAMPDAAMPDAEVDAPIDAPAYVAPTPFAVAISAAGPDLLMSAVPGPAGSFYAAGWAASTVSGAKNIIVVKLTAAGALDTNFGTGGIYTYTAHEFKSAGASTTCYGCDEIDIVTQSDGKIVVSFTVANGTVTADRDIGLIRLNAAGTLDTTFGDTATTAGFARIDLSTAFDSGGLKALDSARALALGPNNTLFVHGTARDVVEETGMSVDSDFAVAKLSANGALDTSGFGTLGKYLTDIQDKDATPKALYVNSDGSVIASGYARTTTSNDTAQPVLYKLTAAGAPDTTSWSATSGLFHDVVLTNQTEIYGFAVDGTDLTTAGYGAKTGNNVWVSLRFNATTGVRDTTFGGAESGAVIVDPSGMATGSNCRNAVGLPGGKTLLLGSINGGGSRDAALAILTKQGALDTAYGTGMHTFSLGGGEDQFWGGAVNNGKVLLVGFKGLGATQTDTANDDSYGLLLPIE